MLQWINSNKIQTLKAVLLSGLFLGAAFLFFSDTVLAQSIADPSSTLNQGVQVIQQPLGLPSTDIRTIIANIIKAALGLLGIILVVLIMYAGFLWMTAGGNEEQISKSKAILKNAVIGLVIILSAYSIVLFIFKVLGVEGVSVGPSAVPPGTQNFRGSGALGQIVKDHYPARDQREVPRNSKIIVTFRKPINMTGLVVERSGDTTLGNCRPSMTSWVSDCDRVTTTPDFISVKRTDNGQPVTDLAISAVYSAASAANPLPGVYTIVIKPLTDLTKDNGGYLGSPTEEVGYTVTLGKRLTLEAPGNPPVFDPGRIGDPKYEWRFECSTALDTDPPYVDNVFPGRGATEVKNSVIQIDFSEPMDPSGIQGEFATSAGGYYFLSGSNVYLQSGSSTRPLGSFDLTNGYRTLEFTPSIPCGTNACGGTIYCLPVCDKAGASCTKDNYDMLIRAARTIGSNTFESQPFSGVMDICGNALDGNRDKKVNVVDPALLYPNIKKYDNDFWTFYLKNEIDLTSPYLTYIFPGLDAEYVEARDSWDMVFSKRMRVDPMYNILIDEIPSPQTRGDNIPLCKSPRVYFGSDNFTTTSMNHCPFLDGTKQEYYPNLDSRIEDAHFNCFYPGKGPKARAVNKISTSCTSDGTCCAVTSTLSQSFCCNGNVNASVSTTASCLSTHPQAPI